MAVSSIAAFVATSVLLVLVPGADWAYAITSGLRDRSVLPAVGGLMLGYAALTAIVAAGVAALIAETPAVLAALTALGSVYLIWLGATTLAKPGTPAATSGDAGDAGDGEPAGTGTGAGAGVISSRSRVLKGAGISGLNPKALLLYLALLPQFADRSDAWPLAAQIGVLGLVHMINCGLVYFGVGTLARVVLRARPAIARTVTRVSGAAMLLIGALLLADALTNT